MAPRMLTWSRELRRLRTLFSQRHTVRLIRITLTRFVSRITTPAGPQLTSFLVCHVRRTAAPPSPESLPAAVDDLFARPLATLVFFTTILPKHGLPDCLVA